MVSGAGGNGEIIGGHAKQDGRMCLPQPVPRHMPAREEAGFPGMMCGNRGAGLTPGCVASCQGFPGQRGQPESGLPGQSCLSLLC
jgi:hypothetical protein